MNWCHSYTECAFEWFVNFNLFLNQMCRKISIDFVDVTLFVFSYYCPLSFQLSNADSVYY